MTAMHRGAEPHFRGYRHAVLTAYTLSRLSCITPMAWNNFREPLAWVLFATVTVVHLHSRVQLELCMTQLEMSHSQMRTNTTFSSVENGGPSERSNASMSDEPSRAVGYAGPLPDDEPAASTSGGTL